MICLSSHANGVAGRTSSSFENFELVSLNFAPWVEFESTTNRLTSDRSTIQEDFVNFRDQLLKDDINEFNRQLINELAYLAQYQESTSRFTKQNVSGTIYDSLSTVNTN